MPTSFLNSNAASSELRAAASAGRDAGRAQCDTIPLEAHTEAASKADRIDPLTILARQDTSRLPNSSRCVTAE